MGYDLKKDRIMLGEERRIFFKRKTIVRFTYPLMILSGFILTVSIIAPAFAIETTKASALNLGEMRADLIPSHTEKSPQSALGDPCLSSLNARFSQNAETKDYRLQSDTRHPADTKAVPVALGLFLGVRLALGPTEIIKQDRRVQMVSEIRGTSYGGNPRALAIAAYRSCKNTHTLKLLNNNKKEKNYSF